MYQKVEEIANLDVGAFEQRMELIEQKVTAVDENTAAIKVDLKGDIRRIQNVVDAVERNSKDSARSVNEDLRGFRQDIKTLEREVDTRLKETEKNLTDKLQKALDNPLAGN
jgi:predicted phage tail protein